MEVCYPVMNTKHRICPVPLMNEEIQNHHSTKLIPSLLHWQTGTDRVHPGIESPGLHRQELVISHLRQRYAKAQKARSKGGLQRREACQDLHRRCIRIRPVIHPCGKMLLVDQASHHLSHHHICREHLLDVVDPNLYHQEINGHHHICLLLVADHPPHRKGNIRSLTSAITLIRNAISIAGHDHHLPCLGGISHLLKSRGRNLTEVDHRLLLTDEDHHHQVHLEEFRRNPPRGLHHLRRRVKDHRLL